MKIALFRSHRHDPLSFAIDALTRGGYCHAGVWDEKTKRLVEAYWPAVRERSLSPGEEADIDFFRVAGWTPAMEAAAQAYCDEAIAAHEPYSIAGLFRFLAPARVFLGDGQEGNAKLPTFCSQFAFEVVQHAGGIRLQNAPSYEVDPTHLSWSPLLIRETIWETP